MPFGMIGGIVAGIVVAIFLSLIIFASRYMKVGPNEVLIITGRRRGLRVVYGGGTFVWPVLEQVQRLSLEIMTLEVQMAHVYTSPGVPISVDAVAQIKVEGTESAMRTAAEQFLSKTPSQILQIAHQTVEGHLRAIVGQLTVEQMYRNRDDFAHQVLSVATPDLAKMGLTIVSFQIKEITDKEGYLDALGRPRIATVKRDAIIAQAEADRDALAKSAEANQAGQKAKYIAETDIAASQRDFEMKKAEYQASVNLKRAEADLAYDLQKYKTGQSVKQEEVQVSIIEKQKQVELQEQEIQRRTKELDATVNKPADAERYRIEALAQAAKNRIVAEAQGEAEAKKQLGVGQAEAEKAQGLAKAAVILAQGTAEAEAMAKKADAWRQYNQAAVTQMVIDRLPEIARAISEPLSKTERIVIINSGGDGAGASKVTKDIVNVMAQLPPAIEALSGVDITRLIEAIPALGSKGNEPK